MKYVTIAKLNPGTIRKHLSRDIPPNISLVKQARVLERVLNSPSGEKILTDTNTSSFQDTLWKRIFSQLKLNDSLIPILRANFYKLSTGVDKHWQRKKLNHKQIVYEKL